MNQIYIPHFGDTGATGSIGPTGTVINNLSTTPLFNPTTPYYTSGSSGGGTGTTGPTGPSGGTDGRLFTSAPAVVPFTSVSIPVNGVATLGTYTIPITLASASNILQNLDVFINYQSDGAILFGDTITFTVSKQIGSGTNFFSQKLITTPSTAPDLFELNPVAVQQQINIVPTSILYSVIARFNSSGTSPIVISGTTSITGLITVKAY
jgi:hypothetical protein